MNLPSSEEIQKDIYRLIRERGKCEQNTAALEGEIEKLRDEQSELRQLIDNPGPYDVPALRANVERIDDHIVRIRGVIIKEGDKIRQFDHMIEDLEDRKCRSEMISRSTGSPTRESSR